jgi:hypothetical protein
MDNQVKEALMPYAEALAIAAVMDNMTPSITNAVDASKTMTQPFQIIDYAKRHFRSDQSLSSQSVPRDGWQDICSWDEYQGCSAQSALVGYLMHIRAQYPAKDALQVMQEVLKRMLVYYDWYVHISKNRCDPN